MHLYACIVGDSGWCSIVVINTERHKKEPSNFDVNLLHKSEKEALVSFITLNVGTILTGITVEDTQKDEQSKYVLGFPYLLTCWLQIKDCRKDVSKTIISQILPMWIPFLTLGPDSHNIYFVWGLLIDYWFIGYLEFFWILILTGSDWRLLFHYIFAFLRHKKNMHVKIFL